MRFAGVLVVALLAMGAFASSPSARAHEGLIEPYESPLPIIARTTVYTFRNGYLDPKHWRIIVQPGAGVGTAQPELQYYDTDAVTVSRGVLHLSALQYDKIDPAWGYDWHYVSGRIESTDAYLYGRFDVKMKVPIGNGLWPAVWLHSADPNASAGGQIDIYDGFGSHTDGFTAASSKSANGKTVAASCIVVENFPSPTLCRRIGNPQRARVNYSRDYHTFSVDWQPDHVTWYVDNKAYWTITHDVPNVPMVLVMDLAVGGPQDGNPPADRPFPFRTRFPADFEIASVAITK